MSGTAVEQLLRLMDGAFTGVGDSPDDCHSLLANLPNVGEDQWGWLPSRRPPLHL